MCCRLANVRQAYTATVTSTKTRIEGLHQEEEEEGILVEEAEVEMGEQVLQQCSLEG